MSSPIKIYTNPMAQEYKTFILKNKITLNKKISKNFFEIG